MAREMKAMEKKQYPVRCTSCGNTLGEDDRIFTLDDLLKQYQVEGVNAKRIDTLMNFLHVSAVFGQSVLPPVARLMELDEERQEKWNFSPAGNLSQQRLQPFACADDMVGKSSELRGVSLNIAAIVAQFYMTTGYDIYHALQRQQDYEQKVTKGGTPTDGEKEEMKNICDSLARAPGVRVDPLLTDDARRDQIQGFLSDILRLARVEAKKPELTHFAPQNIRIGWRYKEENGRKMPYEFVARGDKEGVFDSGECCCRHCHNPIAWSLGAYAQKIVGILGTQAAGKTSYLMALADAVKSLPSGAMTILHEGTDPQWKKVKAQETGLLWRYQNGFAPPKTVVQVGEAPALTFRVKADQEAEPVFYTLADIPGEVFYDNVNGNYPKELIESIQRLLKASDSLILVVNRDQLEKEEMAPEEGSKLVKDAGSVLDSYKSYLPNKPIATAVALTAADKLGDLRSLMRLAFELRNLPALVTGDDKGKKVFNAEMMAFASQAVGDYLDANFQQFISKLTNGVVPKGSQVASFAVSSGTQCAGEEGNEGTEECYRQMCQARFGVEAPLLWLLSCDGLVERGRGDSCFQGYKESTRKRILDWSNGKEP